MVRSANAHQHMRLLSDLQTHQKTKHEIVAKAKKEARDDMKDEKRFRRDVRQMSSTGVAQGTGDSMAPLGQPVRRMGSSGTLFGKSSGSREVGNPRLAGPAGVRDSCVNTTLQQFFNLPST